MTVNQVASYEADRFKPTLATHLVHELAASVPERGEASVSDKRGNATPETVTVVSAATAAPGQLPPPVVSSPSQRRLSEQYDAGLDTAWHRRVPRRTVLLLFALVASDACTLMVIGPFLPAFVEQRLGVPLERNASTVGFISGAYNFGNSLLAPQLGNMSDRHGRRPYLLFSVVVSATLTGWFPFARKAWAAIALRFMTGMLNASSTVSKAFLADLTTTERGALASDRALLFGYFGAVWAIARSLGSAASGALTGVSLPWLGIDAAKNAFITPCIAMSVSLGVVFLVAFMALPESLSPHQRQGRQEAQVAGFLARVRIVFRAGGPVLRRLLVCNGIHQFCNGGLLIILVLFASESRLRGGMGFGPNAVGVCFSYFGFVGVLFQLTIFRRVLQRLGSRRMYLLGTSLLACGTFLAPAALPLSVLLRKSWNVLGLTAESQQAWGVLLCDWIPILLLLFPIGCGFMAGLPILNTLVANAAPLEVQGLAQGLCQSSGGILRTLGPVLTGTAFGYLAAHAHLWFSFVGLSVLYVLCGVIVATLPPTIERSYEEAERLRVQEAVHQTIQFTAAPASEPGARVGVASEKGVGSFLAQDLSTGPV